MRAAGRVIMESGVTGLTIKRLAAEMGFTEGAIYRHFSSKEQLVEQMLVFLADQMDELYRMAVVRGLPPENKLRRLFAVVFSYFAANPHFAVVVFSDGLLEVSDAVRSSMRRIMEVKVKHLLPVIVEGQNLGRFNNEIRSADLLKVVMGAVRLHMFRWKMDGFKTDVLTEGLAIIDVLLTLIDRKEHNDSL